VGGKDGGALIVTSRTTATDIVARIAMSLARSDDLGTVVKTT
jgi:hypothetical protein